jgi:hypothetical protein
MADLTIDQELDLLDDALRRLKVEYDVYFAGVNKRPPVDNEARMQSQIRRYMENSRLNAGQRYRLNAMAQKYAVFAELWRRKLRVKDQGYRRPEDKLIGVGGFGHLEERGSRGADNAPEPESFVLFTSDSFEVIPLYEAMLRARESIGKPLGGFDPFASYVQLKTDAIRRQYKCEAVEYTLTVQNGQVNLKVRPRKNV